MSGEIVQASLDLNAVIYSACAAVRQLKIARDARIDCDLDPAPANLIGDALQIEQVLSNPDPQMAWKRRRPAPGAK